MRVTVEGKLTLLQTDNAAKLEQIRVTVDEKLHATLEQRLGESFKIVSERLELFANRAYTAGLVFDDPNFPVDGLRGFLPDLLELPQQFTGLAGQDNHLPGTQNDQGDQGDDQ